MSENVSSNKSVKKRTKKGRFNLIDFLLIVIILALIAGIVYVFIPSSLVSRVTADETYEIQYTLELTGVDEAYIDNILENDIVIDSVSKSNLGTVAAVDYSIQYTELAYNENESVGVLTPVAGKYNVIVTVNATAQHEQGKGYSVNGTRIAVGEKINARFPNYVCECYCISIPLD